MARSPNSPETRRAAREVIDAAIAENRPWDRVALLLIGLFAAVGLGVVAVGVWRENGLVALSGTGFAGVAAAVFRPALRHAASARRENIALRLLELSFTNARSEAQAGEIIQRVFLSLFQKSEDGGDVVPPA